MNHFQAASVAFGLCLILCGCGEGRPASTVDERIKVGGLYAVEEPDGKWRVLKVLALDENAVHLRSYVNSFDAKPTEIDSSTLTLGGIDDPAGMGIGHFPMAKQGFFLTDPVLLAIEPVQEEELEGYRLYLEATKPEPSKLK